MTRLTIDLPNSLHKVLKSISVMDGQTMKDIAITALEKYTQGNLNKRLIVKKENNPSEKLATKMLMPLIKKTAAQIQNSEITEEQFQLKFNKIQDYIAEDEAEKMLVPYLKKIIDGIESKKEKTYNWKEVKKKLKKI